MKKLTILTVGGVNISTMYNPRKGKNTNRNEIRDFYKQ